MKSYEDRYIHRYKPPKNKRGRVLTIEIIVNWEFRMTISVKPTLVFRGVVAINMARETGVR